MHLSYRCSNLRSDMNLFGSDMILFGYDMILLGSRIQFYDISILLVVVLINFGVKKQVPQVSFKMVVGDMISFHTFGSDMKFIGYDMILIGSDLILFGSIFQFHELLVLLVAGFINFGVTNQVSQVLQNY